jgi:hypothetical protein
MERIKTAQEQLYDGVIFRLDNLIKDKEIDGLEFEDIRNTLNLVLSTLKSEFKIGQDNSELVHQLENQLYSMDQSKLKDSRFESFRGALGKIETILNHELE